MFPLTHFYTAERLLPASMPLAGLGSVFPDLGAAMGIPRLEAHVFGYKFWRWCRENAPEGLPYALGMMSHCIAPPGIDYYADEEWQGRKRGFCFQLGERYAERVRQACNLPEKYSVWKAHNFVEMSLELILTEDDPQLPQRLLACVNDAPLRKEAARLLERAAGVPAERAEAVYLQMPAIFSLQEVSPEILAEKYAMQLERRHEIVGCDLPAMAELLSVMRRELEPELRENLAEALRLTDERLQPYQQDEARQAEAARREKHL